MLIYLHEHELKAGDKLPTHAELVKRLKVCHDTLNTAMKWLVEEGVLSRRQRLGTVVAQPYPSFPRRAFWQVGIVAPPLTSSYFISVLIHCIHRHLGLRGFSDRTYMLSVNAAPSSEVTERHPEDFSGLVDDLDNGVLNALITPARLVTDKVPVCGVGSLHGHFGATIDHRLFAREAVTELLRAERRRIAAAVSHPQDSFGQEFARSVNEVRQSLGLGQDLESVICSNGIEHGHRLAREILARPRSKRIDAVIVRDDMTAQACAAVLAAEGGSQIAMAVQTNLQIPISFALPVLRFALDVDELAEKSVEMLLEKLLRPSRTPRSLLVPARLLAPDAMLTAG